MATPTKADIEKARKHFWDSAPSRTPEEAIEKLAQFRADAVADEREAAYRAGQERMFERAYERWGNEQVAYAVWKETLPIEPPPSEGKA